MLGYGLVPPPPLRWVEPGDQLAGALGGAEHPACALEPLHCLFVLLKQTQKWLLPILTEKLVSGGLLQGFIWYLPS